MSQIDKPTEFDASVETLFRLRNELNPTDAEIEKLTSESLRLTYHGSDGTLEVDYSLDGEEPYHTEN